jgi:nicotinamidase-related amidase
MSRIRLFAEPAALDIALDRSALLIIDMQRDFLEPGGFGEALGNDVSKLQAAVGPCKDVLGKARELGMLVIHTREGHRPDLTDAPRTRSSAAIRQRGSALPARWAASWCAASPVTTSSRSSIRRKASR